jgi:hypothetical protein
LPLYYKVVARIQWLPNLLPLLCNREWNEFQITASLQSNFANGGVPPTHFHCFSNYWLVKSLCLCRGSVEALIYFEQIAGLLVRESVNFILQFTSQNVAMWSEVKFFRRICVIVTDLQLRSSYVGCCIVHGLIEMYIYFFHFYIYFLIICFMIF